jgi:hypothetical protein
MPELPKTYTPSEAEDRWYQRWLDEKCFEADPARVSEKRPAYSIVIPPPNVTGILTLGHVLNNTIQDILARRARMLGKEVLWLPGTDHAGIATQNVVEKTLKKRESSSIATISAARASWQRSGSGRRSTAASSSSSSRSSVPPATGAASVSPLTRLQRLRHARLRRSLQKGPHLPWQTHGELVPVLAHRAQR